VDFPDNGLVATTEEKVVDKAAEGLDGKEREENEADDLVGGVISTCLFVEFGLATLWLIRVDIAWTYIAELRAQINSCSKTDNDEAVSRGLNNTMTDHAVAQTKHQNTQREENYKGDSHEDSVDPPISCVASSSRKRATPTVR
jgi:hypothetical protein